MELNGLPLPADLEQIIREAQGRWTAWASRGQTDSYGNYFAGYYAAIPYRYSIAGEQHDAGMVCDVMTDPAQQGKGIFTKLGAYSTDDLKKKGLAFTTELTTVPVLGQALWRVTPDLAIKEGLEVAFAPGYDVPDRFVEEFDRMTYTSYASDGEEGAYTDAAPLDRRIEREGIPLLAIFGAEDQIYEAEPALAAYAKVPGARTALVPGAGHSPNVEKPGRVAALILGFDRSGRR